MGGYNLSYPSGITRFNLLRRVRRRADPLYRFDTPQHRRRGAAVAQLEHVRVLPALGIQVATGRLRPSSARDTARAELAQHRRRGLMGAAADEHAIQRHLGDTAL